MDPRPPLYEIVARHGARRCGLLAECRRTRTADTGPASAGEGRYRKGQKLPLSRLSLLNLKLTAAHEIGPFILLHSECVFDCPK